jgi:hypothetical protein
MSRLDEIRARLAAATPGPWGEDDCIVHVADSMDREYFCWVAGEEAQGEQQEKDAELICHAPEDIAWLLAKCERYREALREIDDSMLTGQQAREVAREVLSEEGDG